MTYLEETAEQVTVIAAKAAIQKGDFNGFAYEMTAVTPILALPRQGVRELFRGSRSFLSMSVVLRCSLPGKQGLSTVKVAKCRWRLRRATHHFRSRFRWDLARLKY